MQMPRFTSGRGRSASTRPSARRRMRTHKALLAEVEDTARDVGARRIKARAQLGQAHRWVFVMDAEIKRTHVELRGARRGRDRLAKGLAERVFETGAQRRRKRGVVRIRHGTIGRQRQAPSDAPQALHASKSRSTSGSQSTRRSRSDRTRPAGCAGQVAQTVALAARRPEAQTRPPRV